MGVILFLLLILCAHLSLYAIPALNLPRIFAQPDGSPLVLRQWGDERIGGFETLEGYTVIKDSRGYWVYAGIDTDGRLVPTHWRADGPPPVGIPKHVRPKNKATFLRAMSFIKAQQRRVVNPSGTGQLPVILVNYSDTTITFTRADFQRVFFGDGTGSLKDYYREVSYGNFSVTGSVTGWIQLSKSRAYYGADDPNVPIIDVNVGELVYEAVQLADSQLDYSVFDTDGDCRVDVVAIVHQGFGQEASGDSNDVWSHRWVLSSAFGRSYVSSDPCGADPSRNVEVEDYFIVPEMLPPSDILTVGVPAHEYAHALGIPDLYDIDYTSRGVGAWSLMAAGSWNYQTVPGDRPAHLGPWEKASLGWVNPNKLRVSTSNIRISPVETDQGSVYQILDGTPGSTCEYFLIENRRRIGFDAGLPGEDLLI